MFEQAMACSDRDRAAFVDDACQDPEIRCEIDSLLRHAAETDGDVASIVAGVAHTLAATGAVRNADARASGDRIGSYRIERLLGAGGMSEIGWVARSRRPTVMKTHRKRRLERIPSASS